MAHGNIEFDPFSDTFFDHPSATSMRRCDEAPVSFDEKYGFYALSRHADVVAAQGDPVRFVSSYGVTLELLRQKQPVNTNMMIVTRRGTAQRVTQGRHGERGRVLPCPSAGPVVRRN